MPAKNDDKQSTPSPQNHLEFGLQKKQNPEWEKINFGGDYRADFFILGNNILVSRPSGYATLADVQQSLKLNHEIIHTGLSESSLYVQIEDYSNLTGATLAARRHFINEKSKRKNLLAVIFCNASPMMRLSIDFGKRIYSPPFDVHITDTIDKAICLAKEILSNHDMSSDTVESLTVSSPSPDIISRQEWNIQFDGFSLQYEIINNNILHPVPSGTPQKAHVDPTFDLLPKIFNEGILKDGSYYLMSDLKSVKGAAMETRRYFVERLRAWHRDHPLKMLIFYNANWIMRAAINISKVTAPYDVYVVDNFEKALTLVANDTSLSDQTGKIARNFQSSPINPKKKYLDELFEILAGVSWEAQTPESILEKVDPDHPYRQIVEAISLIKMDVDHLLAEKKDSEKALAQSSEKYKEILDNIEEGYYEVDIAGNFTFFNRSLYMFLGYSKEELMGIDYRQFSDKNAVEKIYKTFNQVYKTGQPTRALDWKLMRKDGSECFVETSIALIKDKDDNPCGFRGIVRDITHRIEAEKEKQRLADLLRQAQKMEAVGTLAGGVAHDLNNILSGIVSYPDLLLMKLPPASPLRKPIETIKKSGERAAAIVQDLLTLSRRGLPNREIINLNSIITDYLKSPEHNYMLVYHPLVDITVNLNNNLLNISASSIHVIKILMNLISNAAEAMPDGGAIHISTDNAFLDSPLPGSLVFKKGEYVKLQIKDQGVGISKEDRERIFEPFYTKKILGRSGSGLGMALVWGAVQDHDGYIDIQSTPGKGTAITVFFPAVRTEISIKPRDFSIDRFKGKGEDVLVVDDLMDQRELAAELLTQLGYTAHTAESGEAAVEYLKKHKVDLVILDMIMQPGIDGLDTYKEIIKIHPSQKAVIATGFSTSDRIQKTQMLGAGTCLKKPYLLEDFARTIREELDR